MDDENESKTPLFELLGDPETRVGSTWSTYTSGPKDYEGPYLPWMGTEGDLGHVPPEDIPERLLEEKRDAVTIYTVAFLLNAIKEALETPLRKLLEKREPE